MAAEPTSTGAAHHSLVAPPRETLSAHIARQIAVAIRDGHYPPGARLVETELASQMQTSRGPIREALRHLAESGLIEVRPHQGTYVASFAETDWVDMVVMRATLEGVAARLLSARLDTLDLSTLEKVAADMAQAGTAGDLAALRALDWRFHEEICRAAGNGLLLKQWTAMRDGISVLMSQGRATYPSPGTVADSHRALLDVLRSGDPAAAEQHFRQRLLNSGFSWLDQPVPPALRGPVA